MSDDIQGAILFACLWGGCLWGLAALFFPSPPRPKP